MHVRHFDPLTDSAESLANLSPFSPAVQQRFAQWYRARTLVPENILVLEDKGELLGVAHIFDAGLPWAVVDAVFIRPGARSVALALQLYAAVEAELKARGLPFYVLHAPPQLAQVLTERYGFVATSGETFTHLVKIPA